MMRLEDYPPDIQDLLKWAGHHLEQLERLEHDFRAWQAEQGLIIKHEVLPTPTRAECVQALEVATHAEAARRRWEMRTREVGR